MTKNIRRIFFYLGLLIFISASYIAIVYAQGYKYSFKEQRFLHTGAIQLKVNDDAKVFINDELDGTTSLFGNSHTISGLLPANYIIRLDREGFTPWQKTVTVQEGYITDFPRIIILPMSEAEAPKLLEEFEKLLPSLNVVIATPSSSPVPKTTSRATRSSSPSITASVGASSISDEIFILENKTLYTNKDGILALYASNVAGFSVSDNGRKILWWNDRDVWVGWLHDTDYQPYHKTGDRELITRFAAVIKKAAWFRGEDHILADTNGYKIVEIDKRGGQNIIKI